MISRIGNVSKIKPVKSNNGIERIGEPFKIKPIKTNNGIERTGEPFKIRVKNVELQNNVNKNNEQIEIQLEEELIIEKPIQITKKFQSPLNENNKKTQKVKSEKKINKKKLWNIFEEDKNSLEEEKKIEWLWYKH